MARIQVLPLTPRTLGPATEVPFVLIIDQVTYADRLPDGDAFWTQDVCEHVQAETGATLVLVVEGELTAVNVDEKLRDQAQAAVERALLPLRYIKAAS